MKKYLLLLGFMISTASFAQIIKSKNEVASAAQYELLKKVNQFYPDITLSDKVVNFYIDDKLMDTRQEFILKDRKFSNYKLSIDPDNKKVSFDFNSTENGKIYGEVTLFRGSYIRTTFNEKLETVEVMIDGKAVYSKKI